MKTILTVEDQHDVRKLIRMTLEIGDYHILEAADAATGLEIALQHQPDVCLLDVMMPGEMSGLDLCRRLKAHPVLGRRPVVLLSARGQARDVEAGLAAGADHYLVKPFRPRDLLEVIAGLLRPTPAP